MFYPLRTQPPEENNKCKEAILLDQLMLKLWRMKKLRIDRSVQFVVIQAQDTITEPRPVRAVKAFSNVQFNGDILINTIVQMK